MSKTLASARQFSPVQDSPELGTAMSAISPQQRAFVMAYVENATGNAAQAARAAGYGANSPTDEAAAQAAKMSGWRLIHDEKVLAAIRELAQSHMEAKAFHAANVLVEIAEDPTHKDRLKAAELLMNRAGMLVVQEQRVVHEHRVESRSSILDKIAVIAQRNGLDLNAVMAATGRKMEALPAPVTDATFEPAPSSEGLEDLL